METQQRRPRRRRRSKAPTRCARCLANPQDRKYVTMWNTITCRKIAGTAAPCQDELQDYLSRHPHVQVYTDQDGGPEAIKQRRKDRNREKERRKRECKQPNNDGKARKVNAIIAGGEVDCLDKGETMMGQITQTKDERLDRVVGLVQEESQIPKIKEEAEEVLRNPSVELEKLKGVQNEKPGEKETDTEEEYTDGVYPENVFNIEAIPEVEKPPGPFAALIKKEEECRKTQEESDLVTEDKLEGQVEAGLPSPINNDREPPIQSKPVCIERRAAFNVNTRGRKRMLPFSVSLDQSDISFAQRVWTAEAYATIAEREKKRKRETAMQGEDEEIRVFRELVSRTY